MSWLSWWLYRLSYPIFLWCVESDWIWSTSGPLPSQIVNITLKSCCVGGTPRTNVHAHCSHVARNDTQSESELMKDRSKTTAVMPIIFMHIVRKVFTVKSHFITRDVMSWLHSGTCVCGFSHFERFKRIVLCGPALKMAQIHMFLLQKH